MVRRIEPEDGDAMQEQTSPSLAAHNALRYLIGGFCITAILIFSACFSVREGRQAVVLRFGEPVRVADQAGVHLKAPWPVERVWVVDARKRAVSTPQTELLTRDKKNIVLMTGGAWRPTNPVQFYRALGSIENADEKIVGLLINAKIAVFGRYDLAALVSTDATTLQAERVEQDVLQTVNRTAISKYGIQVTHIGFQRVSLPERNVSFVLEQMRAERRQFAAQFRADGELQAARIRSSADLEAAQILATANEEATRIIGLGEAQAARTYARAHSENPEFYRFVRSLETLRNSLGPTSSVTLRTDAEPFRLLVDQFPVPRTEPITSGQSERTNDNEVQLARQHKYAGERP